MTLVERIAEAAETAPSRSGERRLYRAVREGLPTAAVDAVKAVGLSPQEIAHTVAPRRTLSHRRALGRLTPDQSDRLVRLARIIDHAIDTFGDDERALWWLRRPTGALDGEAPIALLDTDDGLRQVEALLERIDHGLAA